MVCASGLIDRLRDKCNHLLRLQEKNSLLNESYTTRIFRNNLLHIMAVEERFDLCLITSYVKEIHIRIQVPCTGWETAAANTHPDRCIQTRVIFKPWSS